MPKRKLRMPHKALPVAIGRGGPGAVRGVATPPIVTTANDADVAIAPAQVAAAVLPQRPAAPAQLALPAPAQPIAAAAPANALVLRGGHWEIAFGGARGIVEDCRGLHYIALLIRDTASDKGPIHAKELVALATGRDTGGIELEASDCLLDERAKAQLVGRIHDIQHERNRASAVDDFERLAALDEEYDRIAEELTRAAAPKGRGGRGTFSHAGEKARKAVAKAITEAIARLGSADDLAPLARHLTTTIRKGQWLSYADSRNWHVDLPLPRK